jgi:hypothetical protein
MQANQFVNIRQHPRNEEGVQMLRADDVRLIETTNLGYLSFGSIIHCFLKSSDSRSLRFAKDTLSRVRTVIEYILNTNEFMGGQNLHFLATY